MIDELDFSKAMANFQKTDAQKKKKTGKTKNTKTKAQ